MKINPMKSSATFTLLSAIQDAVHDDSTAMQRPAKDQQHNSLQGPNNTKYLTRGEIN